MIIVLMGAIDIAAAVLLLVSDVPVVPENVVFAVATALVLKGGMSLIGGVFN
ncbi:MAG: hypothetical protein KAJ54_00225 [Candidatus Aenigmarchaeota archaeon]|nr:hypothetical protein [Candidatus Aenigmarchaeota archaeon]MCK5322053.1 hypothetical protein [Candidatus Aenigmarchaeota archaeon]